MTRPQIVRADTIDLQDQSSPSAQDHSRKPFHQPNGLAAPHQAAELRHVQTERAAEEVALSHAWNNAHNLSEEPPSEDDDVYMNGDHIDGDTLLPQNGGVNGTDHDMEDDGDEGMEDDDGMDKISSSPSISDGGSTRFLWPRRSSSLTPVPSPLGTPNREASGNNGSASSSPVFERADSLRGSVTDSLRRPLLSSPTLIASSPTQSCSNGVDGCDQSSSQDLCPVSRPFSFSDKYRHHWGEYMESGCQFGAMDATTVLAGYNTAALTKDFDDEDRDKITPLASEEADVFLDHNFDRAKSFGMEKSPSDMELEAQLLPIHDPLLDFLKEESNPDSQAADTTEVEMQSTSPTSSAMSEAASLVFDNSSDGSDSSDWTTDSECDDDSFDSFTFNDDDAKSFISSSHPLYICSGWSGECLQETEDIDFEFVYALHNFVATVEGQANAAKGDTMVLLDDSNSYWWLVRVVKDSTIGYLPAEHIETPTERLARLNKHRNIDACKMMYEDTLEKPKNPLRRAMRRRGQKAVTFSEPTYRDAPQYDYSSDEEEEGEIGEGANGITDEEAAQNGTENVEEVDEITTSSAANAKNTSQSQNTQDLDDMDSETLRASEESFERRTRNGTVRNTDSFFRDESIETRKISLTPKLLSEDSASSSTVRTIDSVKERTSSSFDLDKNDRFKEDKKKEKKGVLSIFKRSKKDKKTKTNENDAITSRTSSEISRESPTQDPVLQRKGSKGKLQKAPTTAQPTRGVNGSDVLQPLETQNVKLNTDGTAEPNARTESPEKPAPIRLGGVRTPTGDVQGRSPLGPAPLSILSKPQTHAPIQNMDTNGRLSESPVHVTAADAEPPALVRDSSSDSDDVRSYQDTPSPQMPNGTSLNTSNIERLAPDGFNHSPVSPISPHNAFANGMNRTPQQPTRSAPTQPNAIVPAPLTVVPVSSHADRNNSTSTTNTSSAPSTPVWSDASLRAYLDESGTSDIRDLLLLTQDTTGIVPVSANHPLMANLYLEEKGQLKEMGVVLDGLLGTWMDRKMERKSALDFNSKPGGVNGKIK